ncbi:MAG: hypothetical protein JWM45_90, partial [Pseudonocardiales bacterium]|nr:hypothetical protein [Pseudonocardiales bacterium]
VDANAPPTDPRVAVRHLRPPQYRVVTAMLFTYRLGRVAIAVMRKGVRVCTVRSAGTATHASSTHAK